MIVIAEDKAGIFYTVLLIKFAPFRMVFNSGITAGGSKNCDKK